MKFLGRQLDKIALKPWHDDISSLDYGGLKDASNHCVNVRDIEVWKCSVEHRAIMETSKRHFWNLNLRLQSELEENEAKQILIILQVILKELKSLIVVDIYSL